MESINIATANGTSTHLITVLSSLPINLAKCNTISTHWKSKIAWNNASSSTPNIINHLVVLRGDIQPSRSASHSIITKPRSQRSLARSNPIMIKSSMSSSVKLTKVSIFGHIVLLARFGLVQNTITCVPSGPALGFSLAVI